MKKSIAIVLIVALLVGMVSCDISAENEVCSECGTKLPASAAFCSQCGAQLNSSEEKETYFNEPKLGKYVSSMQGFPDSAYATIYLEEGNTFTLDANVNLKNGEMVSPYVEKGTYKLRDASYEPDDMTAGGNMTWLALYIDGKEYWEYAVCNYCIGFQDQVIFFEYVDDTSYESSSKEVSSEPVFVLEVVTFQGENGGKTYKTDATYVELNYLGISDISELSKFKYLEKLDLWENNISDISALKGLTNLESINLRDNNISDISALKGLTNLESITLTDNDISDISALKGLTNLESLSIAGNNVTDISPLSELPKLKSLDWSDNNITGIVDISELPNLDTIILADNNITGIIYGKWNSLNLTYLNLKCNNISDISNITGLTNVETLYLIDNDISDFSALEKLKRGYYEFCFLEGNNADYKYLYELQEYLSRGLW